ncbi:DTW domain-containing protein [bacterium]|nr:DTW domain-containing protein [bacterium]
MNDSCPECQKPVGLCVCSWIKKFDTGVRVLVLQHPQEPDHELGSAWLAVQCLKQSQLKVGLSWPNMTKAWGMAVDPTRWGVLYLGSGPKGTPPQGSSLFCVDKKGAPLDPATNDSKLKRLEGVIVLDGTWSQAKTLWWRNAWLLKLQRLMLSPRTPSLYRELRREPRRECLSTLESIAEILDAQHEPAEAAAHLRASFTDLLSRYRNLKKKPSVSG